jgi:hypothetical protein
LQKSHWAKWSATRQQRSGMETSTPESVKYQQCGESSS